MPVVPLLNPRGGIVLPGKKCWLSYLYGRSFQARTDHQSLKWLRSFKEPVGQVACWLEALAEYDLEVVHRPGRQHMNADGLFISTREGAWSGSVPLAESQIFQRLRAQRQQLTVLEGLLYRKWEDVGGRGGNPGLQLVLPRTWLLMLAPGNFGMI